jgi:hypothetical protein
MGTVPLVLALLALGPGGCTTATPPSVTLAVHVESVTVDPRTASPVVLLVEDEGEERRLPIWIGAFEAQSIALAMERVEMPRPNTHDLIKNLVDGLSATIERVVITELRDNTFYAVIECLAEGRRIEIDSRPSDAIAIAIRVGAPLFATEQVLGAGGTVAGDEESLDIDWPRAPPSISPRLVH